MRLSERRTPTDRNGLEVLALEECVELLGREVVGRLGISWDALPVVLPVNYVLDRGEIVIRTAPGTKLSAATRHAVVAFEVDGHEPDGHTGWSVLVRGTTREVTDPVELERLRDLPLRPWANDAADRFVVLPLELVTGRRIRGWYQGLGGDGTALPGAGPVA